MHAVLTDPPPATTETRLKRVDATAEGHVIYGPYERLDPGSYEVTFELRLSERTAGIDDRKFAVLDVVSQFGQLTYARREIFIRDIGERITEITLLFSVIETAEFEYRIQALGEVAFDVGVVPTLLKVDGPIGPRATPTIIMENPAGYKALYERGAEIIADGASVVAEYQGNSVALTSGDITPAARKFWPLGIGIDVSHAQVLEDILLLNALRDVSRDNGFYIDIGANDPDICSVTKLFYERGWRGINVEPSPKWFPLVDAARPRDININAAVSSLRGEAKFFDDPELGLGTLEQRFAESNRELGYATREVIVRTMTLTEICERHAPADIHFLKIDVEGHEGAVLRSMDFERFRPWLLCIEAGEPMNVSVRTHHEWDGLLVDADYLLAYSDFLNRYYVAREHSDRLRFFAEPARGYVTADSLPRL